MDYEKNWDALETAHFTFNSNWRELDASLESATEAMQSLAVASKAILEAMEGMSGEVDPVDAAHAMQALSSALGLIESLKETRSLSRKMLLSY